MQRLEVSGAVRLSVRGVGRQRVNPWLLLSGNIKAGLQASAEMWIRSVPVWDI